MGTAAVLLNEMGKVRPVLKKEACNNFWQIVMEEASQFLFCLASVSIKCAGSSTALPLGLITFFECVSALHSIIGTFYIFMAYIQPCVDFPSYLGWGPPDASQFERVEIVAVHPYAHITYTHTLQCNLHMNSGSLDDWQCCPFSCTC